MIPFLRSLVLAAALIGAPLGVPIAGAQDALTQDHAPSAGGSGLSLPDLSSLDSGGGGEAPTAATPGEGGYTAWQIIQFGGWVGYLIIALSIVSLSLVIESFITIRRARLMPTDVVDETRSMLSNGRYDEAAKRVENERSFVGYVVHRGLRERDRGYEAMVKAMEDAADEATGEKLRRIEHLNIIANIATMLGLLGTVLGLTSNFNQISQTVGSVEPRMLAGGIFQALITTVMGLLVGIPSLYFYGMFRNRVDALITEATLAAEHMTEMFKDGRGGRGSAQAASR